MDWNLKIPIHLVSTEQLNSKKLIFLRVLIVDQ